MYQYVQYVQCVQNGMHSTRIRKHQVKFEHNRGRHISYINISYNSHVSKEYLLSSLPKNLGFQSSLYAFVLAQWLVPNWSGSTQSGPPIPPRQILGRQCQTAFFPAPNRGWCHGRPNIFNDNDMTKIFNDIPWQWRSMTLKLQMIQWQWHSNHSKRHQQGRQLKGRQGTETLKDHHPYRHQDCSSALWPHTGHILGCSKDHLHENETS